MTSDDSTAVFKRLKGTINQVDWAEQIRSQANADFDRVAKALAAVGNNPRKQNRNDILSMLAILEEKRVGVMSNDSAGYFIHDWQELRGQVRDLLTKDIRYLAIKSRQRAGQSISPTLVNV